MRKVFSKVDRGIGLKPKSQNGIVIYMFYLEAVHWATF